MIASGAFLQLGERSNLHRTTQQSPPELVPGSRQLIPDHTQDQARYLFPTLILQESPSTQLGQNPITKTGNSGNPTTYRDEGHENLSLKAGATCIPVTSKKRNTDRN